MAPAPARTSAVASSSGACVLWLRQSLRLHDSPALERALRLAPARLLPVFVLDPRQASPEAMGAARAGFLLESLRDLDSSLKRRGSRLLCLRGRPEEVLPPLAQGRGGTVADLVFEGDHSAERWARQRDEEVARAFRDSGAQVHVETGHTLWDPELLLAKNGGAPPTSMPAFLKLVERVGPPPRPLEGGSGQLPPSDWAPGSDGAEPGGVPALKDLGYGPAADALGAFPFKGGETAGLERLEASLRRGGGAVWAADFEKPKTDPTQVEGPRFAERSTTALSPYLRFGCVSARTFYWRLQDDVYAARPKHALPPVSLHGQLLWRELFHLNAFAVPHFHQMEGNPICRQVPWAEGAEADKRLAAWEAGATGFPWIDACMNQLRAEGWLHHLARHAVACFLTRGDLWVSWEQGRDVFDRLLVDSDPALNSANWMWLSCSSYFYQYFRCYSPVAFPKKYDKRGAYVRRWVPALKEMPDAYIYEPWKAPKAVQERAGCVVGRDYPKPIVDHREASQENMARMKAAYDAHKAGAPLAGKGKGKGRAAAPQGVPAGKRAKA